MYKFSPGATSQSIYFHLRSSSTGLSQTALTFASAGGSASYTRQRATATSITLATLASPSASYSSGGFVEVNSSTAPGLYRLDLPDAALAAGVPFVVVSLKFGGVIEESVLVRLESSTSNVGAGSISYTVTVNNTNTGLPVANAEVWVTTDLAGTNVVAGTLVTDAFGQVTFQLDAGTYYLWASEPGYTRTNPTTIVVS